MTPTRARIAVQRGFRGLLTKRSGRRYAVVLALMALAAPSAGFSVAATAATSSPHAVRSPLTGLGRAILPPVASKPASASSRAAAAASGTASPTVTLSVPFDSSDTCPSPGTTNHGSTCLDSQQIVLPSGSGVSMTAIPAAGAAIGSVDFQYRPYDADASSWLTFFTGNAAPYSTAFIPAARGLPGGDYQVRALATDSRAIPAARTSSRSSRSATATRTSTSPP